MLIVCNVVCHPVALVRARARAASAALFVISLVVSVGMWLERFIIIPVSLSRDFLPSSWGMYYPTFWDWSTFIGTMGLFVTLLFLFVRFLPMISIFEMRTLLPEAEVKEDVGMSAPSSARHPRPAGRVQRRRTSWSPRRTRRARRATRSFDAYTPFPIEELAEAMGMHHSRLPLLVLIGGILGGLGGLRALLLDLGDRLSAQRRRPAVQQLAVVHPGHLRVHRPGRRADRRARHARR